MTGIVPILEFDDERDALIEPSRLVRDRDLPARLVYCYYGEVIERFATEHGLPTARPIKGEMGRIPVYLQEGPGDAVAVVQAAVGAALAAANLEELIARGADKVIVCGSAGVVDSTIGDGDLVVPESAVRDEGTSYHYLPPGREAIPGKRALAALLEVLDGSGHKYRRGKTWTTDGVYRETRGRVARRRAEGCITVEMEAAALFTVGAFRGIEVAQLLYGGDDVGGEEWDRRSLGEPVASRRVSFDLALAAVQAI